MFKMLVPPFFIIFAASVLVGCGRAMPPRPPEDFAPVSVSSLTADKVGDSLRISWRAPKSNQLGEELTNIAGYRVLRRNTKEDESSFAVIGEVADSHLLQLANLRAEARAAGLSGRKIKIPDSETAFSFVDSSAVKGDLEYHIVPYQNNGALGLVNDRVVVTEGNISIESIVNR